MAHGKCRSRFDPGDGNTGDGVVGSVLCGTPRRIDRILERQCVEIRQRALSRTARWQEHRQACRHFTIRGRCQLGRFLRLFGHFRPLLRKLKPTAPCWRVSSESVLNSARLCLRTIQLHPRIHLDLPYPLRCFGTNIGAAVLSSRRPKLMGSHALDAKLATSTQEEASPPLRSFVLGVWRRLRTRRKAAEAAAFAEFKIGK